MVALICIFTPHLHNNHLQGCETSQVLSWLGEGCNSSIYQHRQYMYITSKRYIMNSMKLVIPIRFISWKKLFADIPRKCFLPNMIRAFILFGEMYFLLISANNHSWNKRNRKSNLTDFIKDFYQFFLQNAKIVLR